MRNKMTRRVVQTEKLQICLHGVAWRCPSFRQVVESHVIQTGLFMPCSCCHCNFVCCIHCVVRHNYTFRNVVHRIPGHVDKVELLFNFCRHALRERCQFLAHIFLEGGVLKIWVHSQWPCVGLPTVPIFLATAGSRHQSSRVKGTIRKIEITRIAIFEVGWHTLQQFLLGSGNVELKKVSNSFSVLICHFGSAPNEREGMSVIVF